MHGKRPLVMLFEGSYVIVTHADVSLMLTARQFWQSRLTHGCFVPTLAITRAKCKLTPWQRCNLTYCSKVQDCTVNFTLNLKLQ